MRSEWHEESRDEEEEVNKKIVVKGTKKGDRELWRCIPFFGG